MKREGMKNKVRGKERTWPRKGDVALEMRVGSLHFAYRWQKHFGPELQTDDCDVLSRIEDTLKGACF